MRLSGVLRAAGLPLPQGRDAEFAAASADVQKVGPGWLYVCTRQDGKEAEELCLRAKAAGAYTAAAAAGRGVDLLVPAPRRLLSFAVRELCGRPDEKLKVIGVTGTNGKTTVTSVIAYLLERAGQGVRLMGTNGKLGYTTPIPEILYPDMVRAVGEGKKFYVTEVSSHSLAQERVAPVRFTLGVFTNLTRDHLDYHGTMEDYACAKKRLFGQSERILLNAQDPYAPFMAEGCREAVYFGQGGRCRYRIENLRLFPDGVEYEMGGARVRFPVPGRFSAYNSAAALAAMAELGFDLSDAAEAIAGFPGVCGRMETVGTDADFRVIIDYAHTPDGLMNVLAAVRGFTPGRLILLFGAGGERDRGKRAMMFEAAARYADYIVITSDNPRRENPFSIIREILAGRADMTVPFAVLENRRAATEFALNEARAGDTVLLAGKGHEREQIVGVRREVYDEREIVREILQKRKTE